MSNGRNKIHIYPFCLGSINIFLNLAPFFMAINKHEFTNVKTKIIYKVFIKPFSKFLYFYLSNSDSHVVNIKILKLIY